MLRLRRLRGYAQHERTLFNDFNTTPLTLSIAERSRRVRGTEAITNLMALPYGEEALVDE